MTQKYKLAVEDNNLDSKSPSLSPTSQNLPLNAFLVYDKDGNYSYNNKDNNTSNIEPTSKSLTKMKQSSSNPVLTSMSQNAEPPRRRYSLCDLDFTDNGPFAVTSGKQHEGHGRHHRRSSVAIKFQPPKILGE